MTRNTKIILGILVGAVIVLCLCACIMAFSISAWFINRTVTVSTDSVQRTVDTGVAFGPKHLLVDRGEAGRAL